MAEDAIEQTLHISRSVDVFSIPPRAPTGWRSGEWLVANKIFTGRLRVVSIGMDCEIRLEDPKTDQLFAACPVPSGMRNICVEPVVDSSRYFVLRVEDPATKRHAFLGMGFTERGEAFDFNDALVRHEKFVEREKAASRVAAGGPGPEAASASAPGGPRAGGASTVQAATAAKDIEALYRSTGNLGLKEGQTIHVTVKTGGKAPSASSWLAGSGATAAPATPGLAPPPVPVVAPAGAGLFKLAPPPADLLSGAPLPPPPPPAPIGGGFSSLKASPAPAGQPDLLGFDTPVPPVAKPPPPSAPPPPSDDDWAVFN